MRSKFFMLFLLAMFSFTKTDAQCVKGYGLKFGATSANQSWSFFGSDIPYDTRWGIDVGVFVEVLDNPNVSFLAELHFIQKGFSSSFLLTSASAPDGWGEYITLRPHIDYLSIPILAKLRFETPAFTPYVVAGPRVDLRVGTSGGSFELAFNEFHSVDVGGSVGIGVEVPLNSEVNVLTEFRYSPSFTKVLSNDVVSVRNTSFEFLLGVSL